MLHITLENEKLRVIIDPEYGASIMAFFAKKAGQWLPLMPDSRTKHSEVVYCASFLMIPYSNRIENGEFVFEGKKYQLNNAEQHSIHGDVRLRSWQIEHMDKQSIICSFDSTVHDDINWPWAFKAQLEYTLKDNEFFSRLSLTNSSDTNMPAGFGWHPFFSRNLTGTEEPVYLQMKVNKVYPDANHNMIPSGPVEALKENQNFTQEKPLSKDNFLDTCFYGYDGNGYIAWPESDIKLQFKTTPNCTHLVIYNPNEDYFAVEPVTNANNGVNLYTQGDQTSGIVSLEPNESLEADFSLRALL